MADILICPTCGAANALGRTQCVRCAHPLSDPEASGEGPRSEGLLPAPFLSREQQMLMDEMRAKIVRPSSRRRFLVGLLGSGVALALGSVGAAQLAQTLRVAFHSKNYPYNSSDDLISNGFSPDLNFMALIKASAASYSDTQLYVWDYQQQRMTSFQTGPVNSTIAWSPDSALFLNQTQLPNASETSITLDIWDRQARQKIRSHTGNDLAFTEARWSPDGSKIGLLQDTGIAVLDALHLTPVFTHTVDLSNSEFTWSPDSQRVALLVSTNDSHTWSIQIWDIQTRAMELETFFDGQTTTYHSTLAWSPNGTHIAAISHQHLQILRLADGISSYALDMPNNDYGALAWSPDGNYLAVAITIHTGDFMDTRSTFGVWNVIEQRLVRTFNRGTSPVPTTLAWSKDGTHIIAIGSLYGQENWDWP